MTPELRDYIDYKIELLSKEFKVKLKSKDKASFNRCTTVSSVDMAAREILIRKWEQSEYES